MSTPTSNNNLSAAVRRWRVGEQNGEYGLIRSFDFFLAYNVVDFGDAASICTQLRERGLCPWLDKEQVRPGCSFQDAIQEVIRHIGSAAICIGMHGLGPWQTLELKAFVRQCVEREIPVIPVLLPGVTTIPDELVFLKEFNHVLFQDSVEEPDALNYLYWGITGNRPDELTPSFDK